MIYVNILSGKYFVKTCAIAFLRIMFYNKNKIATIYEGNVLLKWQG